jgi:hypothetical protein
MGKASDMGKSWVDTGRSWASGLKLKQWFKWITGDAPLPDTRSRKIMAGTAGLVAVLVALGALLAGGGGSPTNHAKPNAREIQAYIAAERMAAQRHSRSGSAERPTASFLPPTTTTTSTTAPPRQVIAASKKTHRHQRPSRTTDTAKLGSQQ